MASDTSSSNPLLQPVQQGIANEYYTALLASLKANGVEIRPDAGGGRGKGVFAAKGFEQGDVLWTERPLVRASWLPSPLYLAALRSLVTRASGPANCCCYCHRCTA
jgi:hypothetical protein